MESWCAATDDDFLALGNSCSGCFPNRWENGRPLARAAAFINSPRGPRRGLLRWEENQQLPTRSRRTHPWRRSASATGASRSRSRQLGLRFLRCAAAAVGNYVKGEVQFRFAPMMMLLRLCSMMRARLRHADGFGRLIWLPPMNRFISITC